MTGIQPPVLILGTGAMACLFAARLSAAGVPVTMLGTWNEGLRALRQDGVTITEPDGSQKSYPVQATDDPSRCAGARLVLVLVKSWQTERAAAQLAACLAPDGLALTLQNGMGNQEILARAVGSERAALGATTNGAFLEGPGRVRPGGEGVITLVAHPRIQPFIDLFKSVGFTVETSTEASSLLWGKLVINAAINPITALLHIRNGAILELPSARLLSASVAREAALVAEANGVVLPYSDPVGTAESIARRTAPNLSSMLQDLLRGARTEIQAICGSIVDHGEKSGIPTPINRTLLLLISALEEKGHENLSEAVHENSYLSR